MRREPPRPEMNVTPLVDVVLVLLIIFMVITPQMEAGASVTIPGISNVDAESKTKLEPITQRAKSQGVGDLYNPMDKSRASIDHLHAAIGRANAVLRK